MSFASLAGDDSPVVPRTESAWRPRTSARLSDRRRFPVGASTSRKESASSERPLQHWQTPRCRPGQSILDTNPDFTGGNSPQKRMLNKERAGNFISLYVKRPASPVYIPAEDFRAASSGRARHCGAKGILLFFHLPS